MKYLINKGSGVLTEDDFTYSLNGGVATLTSSLPTSLSTLDNITFTLGVSISGTSDGNEILTVNPASTSIFDVNGNAASTTQSSNTITLNDGIGPKINSLSLASDNSTLTINFNENIYSDQTTQLVSLRMILLLHFLRMEVVHL